MYRFFVTKKEDNHFLLSKELLNHLKVIRIKKENIICIYEEKFYLCKVEGNLAEIIEVLDKNNEYQNEVVLCASLINIKRFEWLIQKAAELGATKIIPIITKNTNLKYKKSAESKYERWNYIAKNACEQSFRNKIMKIDKPSLFEDVIKMEFKNKIIAHEKYSGDKISNLEDDIIILVGPEGGFNDDEVKLAEKHNFTQVSLGPRILRAETSSIFLLSIIK